MMPAIMHCVCVCVCVCVCELHPAGQLEPSCNLPADPGQLHPGKQLLFFLLSMMGPAPPLALGYVFPLPHS